MSALAGLVASVATVVALFEPFDREGSVGQNGSAAGSTSAGPGASPRERLVGYLPVPPSACRTPEAPPAAAVASVYCSLDGADAVTYSLFDDAAAMYAAYAPSPVPVKDGNCANEWSVESTFTAIEGKVGGRIKCYSVGGTAFVTWTRDDVKVHAIAFRTDGDERRLFTAWTSAGPYP